MKALVLTAGLVAALGAVPPRWDDPGMLAMRDGKLSYGGAVPLRDGPIKAYMAEGRLLFNPTPAFDLAFDTYSVGAAIDADGEAGTPGFGGVVRVPSGRVLALGAITGQIGGQHVQPTELQGLRLFMRNRGADLNTIMRGLYLTTSLVGGGHNRTAYFRADAEPGATGYLNAANFAVKAVSTLLESVAILVSSEGAPGKSVGVYMNSSQLGAVPWGTGIVIGPSTYAHVQYRTGLGGIAAPAYSEETIPLAGAVNDSAEILLPAGVLIRAVLVQAPAGVIVSAGDTVNPARFLAASAGGGVGLEHHRLGQAAQTSPGRVRLTVTGPPSGSAKVIVFYERFVFEGV